MAALNVLTVGMMLSVAAKKAWERRGVLLTLAHSPGEAVPLLHHGDFDLCLLGNSVSNESRAKLAGIIKEMLRLNVPVISIRDDVRAVDRDVTMNRGTGSNLAQLGELMREAQQSEMVAASYMSTQVKDRPE